MKFTKWLSFYTALIVAGNTATVFAVSEDPLQQFKLASLAFQNGRLDSAEQEYEGFLKAFPGHRLAPQARLALGEIKFSLKKFPDAANQYSMVVKKYGERTRP